MAESRIPIDVLQASKSLTDFTKPTLLNGTHYEEGVMYAKIGCFVFLYVAVQFDSPPTNTVLFILPEDCRPIANSEVPVSGGASYNAKAQCQITKYGQVKVTSVDNWVSGSGIFTHV